ncbi:EmrB/QacA subfamily drug resistance transporter [Pseudochelatococcus lubricantis]|uniref:EmrB/QacA subfamily drug resistance transporter n=2 Tax=Pseudochelatococcus lubricantis TaxID=1538102 RepID=A0ABX0V4B2_9HYPH|nr:EmrB/QacA subfamily drug resistance transporter [Pseudochelatococcus lubricantis]
MMTVGLSLARNAARPLPLLLTASTGCAMTVLDTNIVAIVLPTIARDFGASFAEIEWVVSTYVLCFASLLLPAGAVADRFGRRRVFLVGIGAFALASLLCGLAPSAAGLYLARAFQGAAAAFLLAPALAVIAHAFHGDAERNRAWAIWGGIMGLTMVLSPIAGGVIAHLLGWRWAFHVNVPICAALAGAAFLFVDESRDEAARRLDPAGILFFASAMFGLTWGLINGQAHGWTSMNAVAGFAGGAGALVAFVIAERLQARPMLDLGLFRNPRLVGAVWAMFAYAACAQVMASLLPLFLQNGLGRPPLEAGFAMLPFALAMLTFPHVGRLLGRYLSPASILVVGLVVVGLGNALTGWGAQLGAWSVVMLGMLVLGSGGGLLNGETQKAIMGVVPRERAGMASGISTTARFSGILLGFAMLSGILATAVRGMLATGPCDGAEACALARAFADAVVAGDLPQAASLTESADVAIAQARTAYSAGFSAALLTAALIAGLSAVVVWRLMRAGRASRR